MKCDYNCCTIEICIPLYNSSEKSNFNTSHLTKYGCLHQFEENGVVVTCFRTLIKEASIFNRQSHDHKHGGSFSNDINNNGSFPHQSACRYNFNSLPDDKILDWPKLKAFADDKINRHKY